LSLTPSHSPADSARPRRRSSDAAVALPRDDLGRRLPPPVVASRRRLRGLAAMRESAGSSARGQAAPWPAFDARLGADQEVGWFDLDAVDAAIVITDTELRTIGWNRSAERLYGWTAKQVIGRRPCDTFVPLALQPLMRDIAAGLARGRSWTGNVRFRRADGSSVLVRGTHSSLMDRSHKVTAFASMTFAVEAEAHPVLEDARADPGASPSPSGPETRSLLVLPWARKAFVGPTELSLTDSELGVLDLLHAEQGRPVHPEEISRVVWGHSTGGSHNFVQAHVSRLRRKLRNAGIDGLIRTKRGVGYFIPA
jgi:PAS domain S-box-containing protein